MKLVKEHIEDFLNEGIEKQLVFSKSGVLPAKTGIGKYPPEVQDIYMMAKKNGGTITIAECILRFIQYMSKIKGGATFTEISKFTWFLTGNTKPYTKDCRGHYCTAFYSMGLLGNHTETLPNSKEFPRGGYYIDPSKVIKGPFYPNQRNSW